MFKIKINSQHLRGYRKEKNSCVYVLNGLCKIIIQIQTCNIFSVDMHTLQNNIEFIMQLFI